MDEDIFYASDNKSSMQLIKHDFAMSDRRSRDRRRSSAPFVTIGDVVPAICIAFVAIALAISASIFFPS